MAKAADAPSITEILMQASRALSDEQGRVLATREQIMRMGMFVSAVVDSTGKCLARALEQVITEPAKQYDASVYYDCPDVDLPMAHQLWCTALTDIKEREYIKYAFRREFMEKHNVSLDMAAYTLSFSYVPEHKLCCTVTLDVQQHWAFIES